MKKVVLLFLINIIVFASQADVEFKIYTTIINSLFPNKNIVYVWCDSNDLNFLDKSQKIVIIPDIKKADILIISHQLSQPEIDKIIFTRDYKLLKKYKENAVGGFYWQKGRPNILFLKRNLQKFHLELPKTFKDYIEDEF